MLRRCLQTLENGQRCNAPATDTSKYCRHHDPQLPPKAKETAAESEPLMLPSVVDKPSALAAINMVLQALGEGRIKRSVADTLLSAIKLAVRLIAEMAELGETISAAGMADRFYPVRNSDRFQPTRNDDKLAIALAAAAETRKPNPFSSARPSSALQSDVDPATARIVKELLAQTQQFAKTQNQRAKS